MKRPLVASLVAAGAFAVGGIALAGTTQFRGHLTTSEEVPAPVNVVGTPEGVIKLKLAPDGQSVRYDLKITDPIQNVLMAHLHLGQPGETGGIVVWLYPAGPPAMLIPGETFGHLATGVITVDNLVGALDNNWEGFVAALESGGLYANVHTSANMPGEIRSQVHLHPDKD
jgi:hypothetical protein